MPHAVLSEWCADNEVPKFLAETPSERTRVTDFVDPFDAAHPFIIPLKLSGITSYFDVFSPTVTEYESEAIPKIHLIEEERPLDPSTNEYSEQETQMLDHQDLVSIPTTVARGPVFVSTIVSYSLAYDAADVMVNDNLLTSLSAQIQINISLIGTVRKLSIESMVLAQQLSITPEKAQKTIQATTQRGIQTNLCPLLSSNAKQ